MTAPDEPLFEWQRNLQAIMDEVMRPTREMITAVMEETTRPMRDSIAASMRESLFAGLQSPLQPVIDELRRSISVSLPTLVPLHSTTIDIPAILIQARNIAEDVEYLDDSTDTAAAELDRQKSIAAIRQRIREVLKQLVNAEKWLRAKLEAGQEVAGPYKDALETISITISGLTAIYVLLDNLLK